MESRLRVQGFSDEEINQALELDGQYDAYIRTGEGRDELLAAVEQAQDADWLEATGFGPTTVPFYDELSERQQLWRDQMDTDVTPLLEQMDFPILYVLGANDPLIPASRVKADVESILKAASHQDFAVEIFPDATHNIMVAPTDCRICLPDPVVGPFLPLFAPGYLNTVSDWVTQRVETAS